MPSDGKPEHELPFTAEGRKAFMANKPTFGITQVPSALTNDPMPGCDPQGFPRIVLHNAHTEQIIQTPTQVVILYQFNKKWRVIWTDGRALPRNPEQPAWAIKDAPPPESRLWGYSVGRWVDDYTFVAESNGFDDRTLARQRGPSSQRRAARDRDVPPRRCRPPGEDDHDRRPEVLHPAVGRSRQASVPAAISQPGDSRAGVRTLRDSEIQPAVCEPRCRRKTLTRLPRPQYDWSDYARAIAAVSARRVKTGIIARRYSSLAWMSELTSSSSAPASRAAASMRLARRRLSRQRLLDVGQPRARATLAPVSPMRAD